MKNAWEELENTSEAAEWIDDVDEKLGFSFGLLKNPANERVNDARDARTKLRKVAAFLRSLPQLEKNIRAIEAAHGIKQGGQQ